MYRSHVNNKMFWDMDAFACVFGWGSTYVTIEGVRFDRNGWVSEIDIVTEKHLFDGHVQTLTDREKIEAFVGRWLDAYNQDRLRSGRKPITPRAYKNRYTPVIITHGGDYE